MSVTEKTMGKPIDDKDLDHNFAIEVEKESGTSPQACYQCGTCVCSCPVTDFGQNTRKLMRKIIFGLKKEVLEDEIIWMCTECYYCAERCPQGIDLPHIWIGLRRLAARQGIRPTHANALVMEFSNSGRGTSIPDAINVRRQGLKLNDVKKLSDKALKDIATILEVSGLNDLMKLKKEKGEGTSIL